MYRVNPYLKHYIYINAALIALHANFQNDGFRQKDLKFYIELLSNWMESSFKEGSIQIKNTQIMRIIEDLVETKILQKKTKKSLPYYRLTNEGFIIIAKRLATADTTYNLEDYFFIRHFTTVYHSRIEKLFETTQFLPSALNEEFKVLFNSERIKEKQIESINLKIKKLEIRIDEAIKMSEYGTRLISKGHTINETVELLTEKFPYQLNHQKKMNEVFEELSTDLQLFELTQSPALKAKSLWGPQLEYYKHYLDQIVKL